MTEKETELSANQRIKNFVTLVSLWKIYKSSHKDTKNTITSTQDK